MLNGEEYCLQRMQGCRFNRPAVSQRHSSRDPLSSSQAARGSSVSGWTAAESTCGARRPRHRLELEQPCARPITRQPTARTRCRRRSNSCGAIENCSWLVFLDEARSGRVADAFRKTGSVLRSCRKIGTLPNLVRWGIASYVRYGSSSPNRARPMCARAPTFRVHPSHAQQIQRTHSWTSSSGS
jgi:hypothetical protein